MASMLMQSPFCTAISSSSVCLFEPFSTSVLGLVPASSARYISLTPKQSPPAPSWFMMWRMASPLLDLLANRISTSGYWARKASRNCR